MAKVPITLKQFREAPLETLATKSEREMERILSQIRKSFIRQAKNLYKKKDEYFSYALDAHLRNYGRTWDRHRNPKGNNVLEFEVYDDKTGAPTGQSIYYDISNYEDPRVMSRNKIIQELAQYHTFFNSATSTIPGIKKYLKETNIRLFGASKKGTPLREMTLQESRKYWAIYSEFMNSDKRNYGLYGSNPVQQAISAFFSAKSKNDFLNWDLAAAIQELREYLDIERYGAPLDDDIRNRGFEL